MTEELNKLACYGLSPEKELQAYPYGKEAREFIRKQIEESEEV
jgi:hypothetical protein